MQYKVKVSAKDKSYINVRTSPALGTNIIGKLTNGTTVVIDDSSTSPDGYKWYKIIDTEMWICAKTPWGENYVDMVQDLEQSTSSSSPSNGGSNANLNGANSVTTINDSNSALPQVPTPSNEQGWDDTKSFQIFTNSSYPKKYGGSSKYPLYDYKMKYDDFDDALNTIKENMNIPSFYTQQQVNKLTHENFNRYRIEYPDLYMRSTIPVIIFTRPDLHLFGDDNGNNPNEFASHIANDPRTHSTLLKNIKLGKLLTSRGYGNISHNFNPLLSNLAQNLEIADDSVDLLEMGETFTGYKMQYSKHNIKSITSGTLSIKFKETYDLAITDMHQIWVDYQSNVYRGSFKPFRQHIYERSLDYACNIYYFLLDQDGETIKFWSKYFGIFPNNVPKSAFGFDMGSNVAYPEVSVTYSYIYKEDLSPMSLVEFNHDAGDTSLGYKYIKGYSPDLGHSSKTWVGVPFIASYTYNNGISTKARGFKLRWRPKELL